MNVWFCQVHKTKENCPGILLIGSSTNIYICRICGCPQMCRLNDDDNTFDGDDDDDDNDLSNL